MAEPEDQSVHAIQGVIQSWNSGAERLFGFSAEEVLGQRGERVHHFDTTPGYLPKYSPSLLWLLTGCSETCSEHF